MFNKKVLYEGSSDFSHYKIVDTVYDGRKSRLLFGGHNTPQSGLALDDAPHLLFDYNQRFLEIAQSLHPGKVLLIGGGTLTLPKAMLERFTNIDIDVVELDPLLPVLAHRYFKVKEDARLHVYIDEGRHYLDQAKGKYDLIVVDAFNEFTIPRPLYTVGAVKHYARLLKKDGVLAMNFIASYHGYKKTLTHELVATFCTGFQAVSLYPADHTYTTKYDQNLLLVASQKEDVPLDYLQSETVELESMPDDAIVMD